MATLPKEVTDSLMNDQDFLGMSDEDQNQMLDRIGTKYGQMPNSENVLQRAASQIKEPFPYLNWLPGGKELNQGMVQAGNTMEQEFPGSIQVNKNNEFLKQMGGSVLAGNAGGAAAGMVPGMAEGGGMLPAIFRSAVGAASAAQPFHYDTLQDRLTGTGTGAVLGALTPPVIGTASAIANKIGDIGEGTSEFFKGLGDRKLVKSGTQIQEGVRSAVMDKFLGRTKAFDEALSNLPETTHDVTNEMNQLKNMSETNPAIKDAVSNSPIAQKLLYGTESGPGKLVDQAGRPLTEQVADQSDKIVSTRDLQNMRNQLGKNFDYSDPGHDWQLGKSLSDLRLNQAAPFPEEMGAMSKDYKDTINNFNVVKPYLKQSRLGSNILKGFGGEGGAEVRNSLNYFLGDQGNRINNIYQAGQTANRAKGFVTGGAKTAGAGWLIDKIFGH